MDLTAQLNNDWTTEAGGMREKDARRKVRLSRYVPGRLNLRDNSRSCEIRVSKRPLPRVTPMELTSLRVTQECRLED